MTTTARTTKPLRLRQKLDGVIAGKIGTKRKDMRFRSPDGQEWDSRFEWQVFDVYVRAGWKVRRTAKGSSDTLSYVLPVRAATCLGCGSSEIGQQRKYTPDVFCDGSPVGGKAGEYFIEVKGYLRAAQRSLLRAFCKARKDVDLRIIYQRDFPISAKSTISQWTARFLKIPYAIWNGKPVTEWKT